MSDTQRSASNSQAFRLSHRQGLPLFAALALLAACAQPDPAAAPGEALSTREQAAVACTPAGGHASYGTDCASCHPCGSPAASAHTADWTNTASPGFHAFAANQGLASCQGCHGANLDGVGGSARTSCAQCHGASWQTTCTMCHGGTDNQTGAPPATTWGRSADAMRVGAHTAHLSSARAQPVACAACHAVPASALTPGHIGGGTATVTFAGLAIAGGGAPAWNRATGTCASTYCHGGTLGAGGTNHNPAWTSTSGQAACGTCHAVPPPAPHTTSTACGSCHTGYTASTVNAATHVNGVLEVAASACNSCHGSAANAAPPTGTGGQTATTARQVGAHQAHLTGTSLSATPVACTECHAVPTSMTHSNGTVEMSWGTLARTRGGAPVWNGTTCASSYCHGATLGKGGTNTAPTWTTVNGTQDACGTCHGVPPPAPHSTSTACGSCHAGYTATTVNTALHLNGVADVTNLTCTSCHGSAANAAPPTGTGGQTATTTRQVGAHQAHLTGTSLSATPVACTECHAVPTSMTHSNGTVEMTWGTRARTGGAAPAWNGTTCASTYCHGATLAAGGTNQNPSWTTVNGTQDACGTCHGVPPPAPHSTSTACGSCHTGYTATTVNTATHINGVLEVANLTCTSCHGNSAQTATAAAPLYAAPPVDASGAATGIRVGAHQKHLLGGTYANGISCASCHAGVGAYTTAHPNGVRNVAFTGGANANLQKGTWTAGTGTAAGSCSATWCHGAVINRTGGTSGGTATVPSWTGTVTACTACHAVQISSLPNRHTRSEHRVACSTCHGAGYTNTGTGSSITGNGVNKATHVDGVKTIVTVTSGTGIRTWNPTTRSCLPSCHGTETW